MTKVDTAFVIGVIREHEKKLLEEDEYTRLAEAKTVAGSQQVLADTPYNGKDEAIARHLQEVHDWLVEVVDDDRVIQFIGARFDTLNAVTVLLEKQAGRAETAGLSPLGSVPIEVWGSVVWHDLDWERLPAVWTKFLRAQHNDTTEARKLINQAIKIKLSWMKQLAFTPMMKEIVTWTIKRIEIDEHKRPIKSAAGQYEKEGDESLLAIVKKYRLEPVGYDPIMAFWYGKVIEAKGLNLVLAAKSGGLDRAEVKQYQRSLYRTV